MKSNDDSVHNLPTEIFNTEASLNHPTEANEYGLDNNTSIAINENSIEARKRKIEDRMDIGTLKFFKILKLNLLTISSFFLGICLVLYDVLSLKYVILVFGIYDIILIFAQIKKIRSNLNKEKSPNSTSVGGTSSQKQKKIGKKLLTDSIFLDCMGRGLTCASFFVVEIIPGLFYSLCIGPVAICTSWIIIMNIYKSCKNSGDSLSKVLTIILRLFFTLQITNVFLKMDGIIKSEWNEIFWPFWIVFSIMIGLSFTIVLILITKMCSMMCVKTDRSESKCLIY